MTAFKLAKALGAFLLLGAATPPGPIDLPGERVFPESVSIAPDGTTYVGSMSGGVLRVSLRTGQAEAFIKPGAYGAGSLFGVLADVRNHMLWVCSNDFSARGVVVPGGEPGHALKGFDLHSGKGKVSLQLPGEHATCNDMAVAPDGSLLVTDTAAPQILRWHRGAAALETWVRDPMLGAAGGGGLDGIALGADGNVYVNNVRSGALYRIAMGPHGRAGAITALSLSRPLTSPDGMRPIGGMDFALAEGAGRIDRVRVRGDRAEIQTLAEGIVEPTGVDVHRGTAWYVQAHLSFLFDPGKQRALGDRLFRLTPLPLDRP